MITKEGALSGRSVIVSGGGTGIGRACAAMLAADGAAVTICGRTEANLIDAAPRIEAVAAHGGSVRFLVADMTVEEDVARVVAEARALDGDLHGFVANAGGGSNPAPFHLQDTAEFLRVLHGNVLSTFLCIKHAVAPMVAAGGGSFVSISSIAAVQAYRFYGAYPAAKAGVDHLMRNAANEYGPAGVRFNAVRPGYTLSELNLEFVPPESPPGRSWIENTPLNGAATPDDIADLVHFLIGPRSRWITGQAISVDGGNTLRSGADFTEVLEPVYGKDALLARQQA